MKELSLYKIMHSVVVLCYIGGISYYFNTDARQDCVYTSYNQIVSNFLYKIPCLENFVKSHKVL